MSPVPAPENRQRDTVISRTIAEVILRARCKKTPTRCLYKCSGSAERQTDGETETMHLLGCVKSSGSEATSSFPPLPCLQREINNVHTEALWQR